MLNGLYGLFFGAESAAVDANGAVEGLSGNNVVVDVVQTTLENKNKMGIEAEWCLVDGKFLYLSSKNKIF